MTSPLDFRNIGPAIGDRFPDGILPDQHGHRVDLHKAVCCVVQTCPKRDRLLSFYVQTVVVSVICLCLQGSAQAAPKANLWPRWQQHEPQSSATIDFTVWNTFLKKYVVTQHPSGINRMQYENVSTNDRQALQQYVATLQMLPISTYNRTAQQAYWINLYNALTVLVVLEHSPVASIRDIRISPGLFSTGPWQAKLLAIEGEKLSLDDIEHRILRPIWKDNRLHYALNCASLGCPNLAPIAYTSGNLEQLLDQEARAYVNHPRGVTFKDDTLHISSVYIWFQEDFGGNIDGVLQHLLHYASDQLAEQLRSYRGKVKHAYDWRLNAP
jgi:hypothetical protein